MLMLILIVILIITISIIMLAEDPSDFKLPGRVSNWAKDTDTDTDKQDRTGPSVSNPSKEF